MRRRGVAAGRAGPRAAAAVALAALALDGGGCAPREGATSGGAGAAPPLPSDTAVRVPADGGAVLAGTLLRPAGDAGRRGAVLLLSGSGAQDRDGTRPDLPGYRPLGELAEALARAGLVTLRLDDRGTGASTGRFAGRTTDDAARDAAAAVRWLRAHPAVDGARVALAGHSEGALVALLVARADPRVCALALLGAASRSGREVARWQRAAVVARSGWPAARRAEVLVAAERAAEDAAARDRWLGRWFALAPRAVAAGVRQPVLLVHGARDGQVPAWHAPELAAALRAAPGRPPAHPVTVAALPGVNHLLLADPDGDPSGYPRLAARTLAPSVPAAMAPWLAAAVGRCAPAHASEGASEGAPPGSPLGAPLGSALRAPRRDPVAGR